MQPKEILRWAVVVICGGFGLYMLITGLWSLVHGSGDWFGTLFEIAFTLVFAGVPLAVACFAFRGEYRHITAILSVLGGFLVFGVLDSLPRRFGLTEFFYPHLIEKPWLSILRVLAGLLFVFGPFFAAAWFIRACMRFADRRIHRPISR